MNFKQSLIVALVGSFAGAFFAFILVRLIEFVKSVQERKKAHYNALVQIEHLCQEQLDSIGCNIYEIEQMEAMFNKAKDERNIPILMNQPHELRTIHDAMNKLLNIDMINLVLDYNADVRRINDDILRINSFHNFLLTSLTQKLFSPDAYIAQLEKLISKTNELKLFLEEFKEDTIRLIATAVVLGRKDIPLFSRIISHFSSSVELSKLKDEIDKQINITKSDIERVSRMSSNKINKIHNIKGK